jgi:hypothetical protein
MKTHAFAMLKEAHNFKQVGRARVAGRAEHAHEAFGWNVCGLGQADESNRRIDVVAQNCFGESDVAGQHGFEAFTEKFLAELGVALHAVTDGFLKVTGQGHGGGGVNRDIHEPRSSIVVTYTAL